MNTQYNQITGNSYNGRNQAELLQAKQKYNYKSDAWITFLQAKDLRLKLVNAKGKGVAVFKGFQKMDSAELDEDNKKVLKTVSRPMGFAYVFNMDLTEPIK